MVRILVNEELESVCNMDQCIDALYDGLRAYSRGDACRRPRIDLLTPTPRPKEFAVFSTMDGVIRGGYYALRIKPDIMSWPVIQGAVRRVTYNTRPGLYGGLILLFSTENAQLLAIMNDGFVQHMRVAAYEGLGARYLAREDASVVGIIGSGGFARTFAMAYAAVRPIRTIKAYSPTPENLRAYCDEMSKKLDIEMVPMESAEAVARGSDIVAACTNSMDPVLFGRWLEPGMHIANVTGDELDPEVPQHVNLYGYLLDRTSLDVNGYSDDNFDLRTSVIAYISGQAEERAIIPGNPLGPNDASGPKDGSVSASQARMAPCLDWETGQATVGRTAEDITRLSAYHHGGGFASGGIQGIQFATVAGRAYELAVEQDLGTQLPAEMFLQDIPT